MNIRLIAFGIARDILEGHSKEYVINGPHTIGQIKEELCRQYPAFSKLRSLKFAVNEDYREDDHLLKENDEVVIIPPVSGG